MAGYSGYSRSNNAVAAERDGRFPASTLAARLRAFRRFRGCTASDIKWLLEPSEYHHTSKRYNCTDFFDLRDLAEADVRRALRAEIAGRKEYFRLLREADSLGLSVFRTPDGEEWYAIPRKWGRRFAEADQVDLSRLRTLLEQARGE